MMSALAVRPMSLTELDSAIPEFSYPALERRLSSMRIAGLVEAQEGRGIGTPYAVTRWARRGVVPLVAAGHCERVYMGGHEHPLDATDVEAAFLLTTPLLQLPPATSGVCQLEVVSSGLPPIQVRLTFEDGRIASNPSPPLPGPVATASGSAVEWFEAIAGGEGGRLRFSGPAHLAEEVVRSLHTAFAPALAARG